MAVLDLHWRPQYVGSVPTAQELGWALHNKNAAYPFGTRMSPFAVCGHGRQSSPLVEPHLVCLGQKSPSGQRPPKRRRKKSMEMAVRTYAAPSSIGPSTNSLNKRQK